MADVFETQARVTKALRLVAAVGGFAAKFGLDPERVVRVADDDARRMFAILAGVHPPSDATWALVRGSVLGAAALTRGGGPEAQS